MFLSRRERAAKTPAGAVTGPVTVAGGKLGAWLEGERRGIALYGPGGYCWAPRTGEELLVLKAGESGEKPCALGVPTPDLDLRPGEVVISAGEAAIRISPKGDVAVTGTFTVNGTVVGPLPEKEEEES